MFKNKHEMASGPMSLDPTAFQMYLRETMLVRSTQPLEDPREKPSLVLPLGASPGSI